MIWRVIGARERISQFTIVGDTGGVVGVPREAVAFAPRKPCFKYFEAADSRTAMLARLATAMALGRDVDAIGADYDPALFQLPAAIVPPDPAVAAGLDPDWDAALRKEIVRYYEAGVIAIDPADVVASQPAEAYAVLPQVAGLAQLVADGVLERVDRGTYRILKPMARFPAGLYGGHRITIELPPGMPMPLGDPGHSEIVRPVPPAAK